METYVMVHSAWLGKWSFEYVKTELEKKNHRVITFDLPGHGEDKTLPKDITMDSYVKKTQEIIDTQSEKVILVGHSFAGMIISQVAQTRSNKIKSLVYLTAMLVPNGVSFLDATETVKTSVALNNLIFSDDQTFVTVKEDKLHEAFGEDIALDTFNETLPYLSVEPTAPLGDKLVVTDDKFGTIPRYYIQTLNDKAIPTEVQASMITSMGVDKMYTINNSSHLPIFSNPSLVANILDDVSKEKSNNNIKNSDKAIVLSEVLKTSSKWKKAFNTQDAHGCSSQYTGDSIMEAKPFGTFTGTKEIQTFWDNLMKEGYNNVTYVNAQIKILNSKSAVLSSDWSMNKAHGEISEELFEIQEDGSAKLVKDVFQVN